MKILTEYGVLYFTLFVIGVLAGYSLGIPAATASTGPDYGMQPFTSAYAAQSTADQTLLAAPGATNAWKITSVWYHVTTAEANGNVKIEDLAGTPITVVSIPLDTKGAEGMIWFGDGVLCSQNSAVQVDFSGTTGEAAFVINGYKEKKP